MKLTKEQVEKEIELFQKIYQEVRLIYPEDMSGEDAAVKTAFSEKKQTTRLEYIEGEFCEVVHRYIEVDQVPCVMELLRSIDAELVIQEEKEDNKNEGSHFRDLLYRDAVTGAYNRRYYEDRVAKKCVTGGIAMIDLDNFKLRNDTYGHDVGDDALRTVVSVIKSRVRRTDALVRYGGDEFLLIMPDIEEDVFEKKLWDIQNEIYSEATIEYKELPLSVSIGGVMVRGQAVENVIARADRVMYQAKKQKNVVVVEWKHDKLQERLSSQSSENKKRQQILIVDDSEMNRMILCEMLKSEFNVLEAADGRECMNILEEKRNEISLVLLDIVMPIMNGYEVLGEMGKRKWIEQLPVIMISSDDSVQTIRKVYDMGVSDYISRPFDAKVVYRRVVNTIRLYARQRWLTNILTEQIRVKEENRKTMIAILSQIVEFRNGESGLHVQHINILTKLLLNRLLQVTDKYSITPVDQELIVMASSLHDIGKVGVSEAILNKPGKFTSEEFDEMKKHTLIGASILESLELYHDSPLVKIAYEICRWHHERYDGKGYPDGLVREEIPISAQIVSLADVYDALVSERVYKKAYSHEKAFEMIMNGECGVFNPILLRCLDDIKEEVRNNVYIPGGGYRSEV